jgi:hypothetical protein
MIQGHRRSYTSSTRRLNKPIGWTSFASCTGICVTPAWQQAHLSIGYNAQCKSPTIIRRQHPEYLAINAQLAQITLRLLHQVFKHFFLLAKRGATPAQLPSVCCRASRDQAAALCMLIAGLKHKDRETRLWPQRQETHPRAAERLGGSSSYVPFAARAIALASLDCRRHAS